MLFYLISQRYRYSLELSQDLSFPSWSIPLKIDLKAALNTTQIYSAINFAERINMENTMSIYQKIILASGSPRRREIFTKLSLNFQYVTSKIKEEFNEDLPVTDEVMKIAAMKAYDVARIYDEAFIIAADTIVYFDNKILGKPADAKEAKEMLRMLSGNTHEVITGVAVINKKAEVCERFYETTKVTFKTISDSLIDWYIEKDEPFDKAGSYAIQDKGAVLIKKIDGDYNNVVGLPVSRLFDVFGKMEVMPYGGMHGI